MTGLLSQRDPRVCRCTSTDDEGYCVVCGSGYIGSGVTYACAGTCESLPCGERVREGQRLCGGCEADEDAASFSAQALDEVA